MRKIEQPNTTNIHITEVSRTDNGMSGTGTLNGKPCTITTIENVADRSRINITMHSPDGKTPPKIIEGQEALDLLKNTQPTYDEKIIPRETERFTRAVERNKDYEKRRIDMNIRKEEQAKRLSLIKEEQAKRLSLIKEERTQQKQNSDEVRAQQRENRDAVRAQQRENRDAVRTQQRQARNDEANARTTARITELLQQQR